MQGTCHGNILNQGNIVLAGNFSDAQGQMIGALRHHPGRIHLAPMIGQGHGDVGRVGDHHICLGNFGHHTFSGCLLLNRSDTALDMRIAFALLEFFLLLLFGHFHFLFHFPTPECIIKKSQDNEDTAASYQYLGSDHADIVECFIEFHVNEGQDPRKLGRHRFVGDYSYQQHLEQGLDDLNRGAFGKEPCSSLDGIEFSEIRDERFGGEKPAYLQETGKETDHQHEQQDGCQEQHHFLYYITSQQTDGKLCRLKPVTVAPEFCYQGKEFCPERRAVKEPEQE